ncbi:hypothetical protein GCM10010467_22610 [Actinocorallia glomerata]|uniref:Uncharacterized protein n=2 Tax=Actinomycetes TaxID=1760 RepID=A0ABP6LT23_9MICC
MAGLRGMVGEIPARQGHLVFRPSWPVAWGRCPGIAWEAEALPPVNRFNFEITADGLLPPVAFQTP